tara:strand:- start:1006 stop:1491 length:486 start_codon:yes stop_codon:yes gene_type:complete
MTLTIGDIIPDQTLVVMDKDKGPQPFSLLEFSSNKKIVLFGVPGAFTPTCTRNHLPGFIDNIDKIKDKGIDEIVCFATNDIFTMQAWEEMSGAIGKIIFLSDSKAEFSKAIGTDYPDTFGTSIKTKRCSMLIDKGIVKKFFVEAESGQVNESGAENMINNI